MIVCQQCGYQNDDDDQFCGGCPGYLPHVGLLVEEDVQQEAEPEIEETQDNPTGLVQRVKAIVLGDDDSATGGAPGGHESVAVRDPEEAQAAAAEEGAAIDAAERAAMQEAARTAAAQRRAAEEREAAAEAERKAEEAERVAAEAARRAAASEAARAQAAQAAKVEAEEAAAAARAEAASREAAKASEAARVEAARVEAARAEQAEAARISAADAVRSTAADVAREVEEERKKAEGVSRREAEAARKAEEDRKAAEEAAAHEAEAARKAEQDRRAAEEAERRAEEDRRAAEEAERKAEEERRAAKEAAERSRRAAAMVAKAPPPPVPAPGRRPQKAARPAPTAAPAAAPAVPTEPADAPVTARRPAPSERRAPKGKTRPSRVIEPGDLVCGQCGEPNKPERKFCRRCAHSLQEAKVAKVPWWRKLFSGRKKKVAAGERPGRAGRAGTGAVKGASHKAKKAGRKLKWAVRSLAMVATLLVGIGLLGPWRGPVQERIDGIYQSVRSRVAPEFVTVTVAETSASSELPEHPALHATDGADNRHWVAGTPGEGQFLVVRFAEPVHLRRIGFLAGASGDQFLSHPRPREIHLVYDTGGSDDLELTDQPEFQVHTVDAEGVHQVEVHIRSLHPSTEGNNQVAITNIQFSTAK